jgi:hypothetical protein
MEEPSAKPGGAKPGGGKSQGSYTRQNTHPNEEENHGWTRMDTDQIEFAAPFSMFRGMVIGGITIRMLNAVF